MIPAQAERLRDALLDPAVAQRMEVEGSMVAAVLVPLYELDGGLWIVLTQRQRDLRLHGGQISFPGGRRESTDRDLTQTALRETHEEIGLHPDAVTLLGALAPTPTVVSDIAVHPYVGLITRPVAWSLTPDEVETVLEAPLAGLAATHRIQVFERPGRRIFTDAYSIGDAVIWGATGRILTDLLVRFGGALA